MLGEHPAHNSYVFLNKNSFTQSLTNSMTCHLSAGHCGENVMYCMWTYLQKKKEDAKNLN